MREPQIGATTGPISKVETGRVHADLTLRIRLYTQNTEFRRRRSRRSRSPPLPVRIHGFPVS